MCLNDGAIVFKERCEGGHTLFQCTRSVLARVGHREVEQAASNSPANSRKGVSEEWKKTKYGVTL